MKNGRISYADWGKAGLLAPLVMVVLFILLFLGFEVAGSNDALANAVVLIFVFPGVIVFLPFILKGFHNAWSGYFVLSIVLNFFLYTWFVKWMIVRRRRNRPGASQVVRSAD